MNDFFKDIRFSSNELSNEVSKSLGLGRECDNGGLQGQAFKNHMHILFPTPNEHNLGGGTGRCSLGQSGGHTHTCLSLSSKMV